jgi:hypothetical protein
MMSIIMLNVTILKVVMLSIGKLVLEFVYNYKQGIHLHHASLSKIFFSLLKVLKAGVDLIKLFSCENALFLYTESFHSAGKQNGIAYKKV